VCTLRPGEDRVRSGWRSDGRRQAYFEALVPHELDTGPPMFSAAPISPEQWCWTDAKRMQQHAHLARLGRRSAMPLALLTQPTGPTTANTGPIHDAQAAISLSTLLLGTKLLVSWAVERPIWLKGEVLAREATSLPGGAYLWRSIPSGRSGVWLWRGKSRSKLSRANWIRMKRVPQVESQVPDPLGDELPALLSRGRMAAPAVGIDLLVFIREHRLKGPTMQVHLNDIAGGKCLLGQV
jgi:hypothetical protein